MLQRSLRCHQRNQNLFPDDGAPYNKLLPYPKRTRRTDLVRVFVFCLCVLLLQDNRVVTIILHCSTTSILASGTSTFASTTTTTPQPQPQPQLNSLSSPPQQYNPIYSRRHHHRGRTEYLSYLYCTVMNSGTTTTITTQQPHRNRNQSRGTINPLSSPPQQYNQIRSKPYQTKPIQYGTRGSCCFNA